MGCGTSATSSSTESTSEIAAAGAIGGSNSGSSVAFNDLAPAPTRFAQLKNFLIPVQNLFAAAACPYYMAGSTDCKGNNFVLFNYSGCSFGSSTATWNGSQTLAFTNGSACGTQTLPILGVAAGSLNRTVAPGTTRTSGFGLAVNLDGQTLSGYSQSVNGGYTVTGISGGHSVNINGINIYSSRWNHTLSTPTPITVAIDGAGNRTFFAGVVQVQHNKAKYVAQASFSASKPVIVAAGSCFPSSGTISTALSGSLSGTETLVFNGGTSATLTDNSGNISNVTLSHCF